MREEREDLGFLVQPGGTIRVADAPDWINGSGTPLKIGITDDAIRWGARVGMRVRIGQLYGVVGRSLIFAEHIYQGLKRDMYVRDDGQAAVKKLAMTWAQKQDAIWAGDATTGSVQMLDAPPNRVFVVYVSPNEMLQNFPDVAGWAEHWAWLPADGAIRGAPIDCDSRYDKEIWTAPGLR